MRTQFTSLLILLLAIATGYFLVDHDLQLRPNLNTSPETAKLKLTKLRTLLPSRLFNTTASLKNTTASVKMPGKTPTAAEAAHKAGLPPVEVPAVVSQGRAVKKAFEAVEKSEGAGARVRRSIGVPQLRNFSPFLMLDHFSVGEGAGFPDHPHRGQETITYLLHGSFDHEDFAGHQGTIHEGDLQFMTAGRGIMHAEMPGANTDGSKNVGLQLWVDLPKPLKFCEPRYRDLRAAEIPATTSDDGRVFVKVISGTSNGTESVQDLAYTPVWLLDVTMQPGGKLSQPLPLGWNAFVYTLEGEALFAGKKVGQYHNVVLEREGDGLEVVVPDNAEGQARFVIIAGLVLDQPVVQYGPFVLTSNDEVYQAMLDYQSNANGFERNQGWESEIGKRMLRG